MRAACLAILLVPAGALAQPTPAEDAMAAYRRLPLGEPDSYAPTLECFYGELDAPRGRVMNRGAWSTTIVELHAIEATATEATLVDRGWYSQDGTIGTHQKVVRLRRVDGRWLIVGETGARARGCMRELLDRAPPASQLFARCSTRVPALLREVRRECAGESAHACGAATEEGSSELDVCFVGRMVDRSAFPASVASIRDVDWAALRYRRRYWGEEEPARFVSVVFAMVDRRPSAIVTLALGEEVVTHAFALDGGDIIELGTVCPEGTRWTRSCGR